ncbi:MAG: EAL domain-containing protein, partial [Gammaproteobacteria bacterium]|nr:EAL domain-containing protein [Gammaproteobacteria bacterium]
MHRILIIEKSDTRRHVLHKLLVHHGYDIAVATDFESAHHLISALDDSPTRYDGIIFGWPEYTDHAADDFLSLLIEARYAVLPTLILADGYDASKRDWVTRRAGTAMLSWDDYADVLESLSTLISPEPFNLTGPSPNDDLLTGEIRVLFVDDSPTIRVSYRRLLNTHGYVTDTANSVAEALDKLKIHNYDLVITDYFMPNANGDELCRKIRNNPATAHVAVGILTGTYLDRVIKDSLDAGAAECMFKNEAEELFLARVAAMSRTVQFQNSIDKERRRLEGILCSVGEGVYGVDSSGVITFINPMAKKILGWSMRDVLVGKSAHLSFHHVHKDGRPLLQEQCMLQQAYVSGDEIHNHETIFWHATGSSVMVECSVVPLKTNNTRHGSVVAFSDISQRKKLEDELVWQANHDSLTKMHNRLFFEKHLNAEVQQLNRSNNLSALMYVDLDRFKYINDTAGLANADLACNIAKRHGRDQTHIYLPQSDEKIAMGLELGWSVRLREALQKNMFVAHYQPIVALADISMENLPEEDGKLWEHILRELPHMQHHYEVLIRLRSADGEIVHPSAFLPTAERFNMMREVDRWMVTHALKELKRAATYRHNTVFAINLSGVSVGDETLLPLIKNLIAEHNINPCAVIFEVTETASISGLDEARLFIRELS